LSTVTFLLFFQMAQKAVGWPVPTVVSLALMPIIRARASLRPEAFTFLFCGVFLWFLWNHYSGLLNWRSFLVMPALEVLWVNLHIGFIFGPIFIAAFLVADLLERPPKGEILGPNPWASEFYKEKLFALKRWFGILSLTLLATLVNPSGIYGAAYP